MADESESVETGIETNTVVPPQPTRQPLFNLAVRDITNNNAALPTSQLAATCTTTLSLTSSPARVQYVTCQELAFLPRQRDRSPRPTT
jgi:hypothetical protein